MIVYKKKSDQPNIFDEIQNKIVDIVRKRFLYHLYQVSEHRLKSDEIEKKIDILKIR